MTIAHYCTLYFGVAFLNWVRILAKHGDKWDALDLGVTLLWPIAVPLLVVERILLLVHGLARRLARWLTREGA